MISSQTQISLEPTGVRFVTQTSQGAQLVRVTMLLREPTIIAAAVSLSDGKLEMSPMSMTMREVEGFFNEARKQWKGL